MRAHNIKLRSTAGYCFAGHGCKTLVMALVGVTNKRQRASQVKKIEALARLQNRPNIIGDLSIGQNVEHSLWRHVVKETPCVAATLPIYSTHFRDGRIDPIELLDVAIEQMEGGVGLLTIHPTPSKKIHDLSKLRLVPCTSRGGGLVIADAKSRGWPDQNAYQIILPDLVKHAKRNNTVLSIGASFRSANIFDSCDPAQVVEIESQIEFANWIKDQGVGVIIESPGHARPRDIKKIAELLRPSGFPVMPLGPIPTDTSIGMDHISGAIGATLLGLEGCAHILAAVTREEHTGKVPTLESSLEAVASAWVAAHIIDLHCLQDDSEDLAIARSRATNRTCVFGKEAEGCSRCAKTCPLTQTEIF